MNSGAATDTDVWGSGDIRVDGNATGAFRVPSFGFWGGLTKDVTLKINSSAKVVKPQGRPVVNLEGLFYFTYGTHEPVTKNLSFSLPTGASGSSSGGSSLESPDGGSSSTPPQEIKTIESVGAGQEFSDFTYEDFILNPYEEPAPVDPTPVTTP